MRLSPFILFLFCFARVCGNPIVVELEKLEVLKRSEVLELRVGSEFTTISATLTYVAAPDFIKRESPEDQAAFVDMQIPIFARDDLDLTGDALVRFHDVQVDIGTVRLPVTYLGRYTRAEIERWRKSRDEKYWMVPRGSVLLFFGARLPIEVVERSESVIVTYRQAHVKRRGRPYVLYTPFFENYAIWSSVRKDGFDFRAFVTSDDGILAIVEGPRNEFGPKDDKGRPAYLLDHMKHIWIEVKKG